MYCKKCGENYANNAKFCEKCGSPLSPKKEEGKNKNNNITTKLKELPRKTKIAMFLVFILIGVAIFALSLLLNNPVKKVEDSLESYYTNYQENNKKYLIEIGKVLKSNKENKKVLNSIKKATRNSMEKWVKNFNKKYQDQKSLDLNYKKVSQALRDIYNYFNGLEYLIDKDLYKEYTKELGSLYISKKNYLKANDQKDDYQKYYYYQKVIESDSYYKDAQDYISKYIKNEIANLKDELSKITDKDDNLTNEEKLSNNLEEIKFLNKYKVSNNINLSNTKEYKDIYNEIAKNIVNNTKKVIENNDDYENVIEIIEKSLKELNKDSEYYKELNELKEEYEDKLPKKLVEEYRVSVNKASAINWKKSINGKDYDSSIAFSLNEEESNITYRLDKKYKKLQTSIVLSDNWDNLSSGYFVISGDNKEIYKSKKISKVEEINDIIDIDISEVENLKIEFVTTSKSTDLLGSYIYLVEPYLYK